MDVLVTRNGEYVNTIVVDTLNEAAAAYPDCDCVEVTTPVQPLRTITKLTFRRRFTLAERMALDAAVAGLNTQLPAEAVSALRTMQKDLDLAQEINLDDADVAAGLGMLEQLGLLAAGRGAEIRA